MNCIPFNLIQSSAFPAQKLAELGEIEGCILEINRFIMSQLRFK